MAWMSGVLCTALAALSSGCIVEDHHDGPPANTEIDFSEHLNIGVCGDRNAFSWTVSNRQTGDQATASCDDTIAFPGLAPSTTYTFDVTGYLGSKVCWQGACNVDTEYGVITYADCSEQIAHLCGY